MKIISISTDKKIFDENSAVRQRQIEYGKFFDELHLIVLTPNNSRFKEQKLSENVFLYPTKTKIRFLYILCYLRIIKKILKKNDKKNFVVR
jgi:hypothetical protein